MAISRSDRPEPGPVARPAGPGGVGGCERDPAGILVTGVAVVGAGPAGLSAAVAAADGGASVTLIDAEPVVGGQFWRHPAYGARRGAPPGAVTGTGTGAAADTLTGPVTDGEVAGLHHDVRHYGRLRRRLAGHIAAGTVRHLARHEVWAAERLASARDTGDGDPAASRPGFAVHATAGRRGITVQARALVLATGAYDLQVPFPGWDLPGVMTAGGVQSLLKGHAVLAGRRVVVAGTGPFLLSVASGLARGGATVLGVFEAARPAGWLREPRGVVAAGSKILEGAGYARDLLRHRIGYRSGWTVLSARGTDRLESVAVAPLDRGGMPVTGRSQALPVDVLAVGWGFVPQLEVPLALGCGTTAGAGGLPVVLVDADQRTTVPGVYAAGETCGIGGAALAAIEGEIAGRSAAADVADRPTPLDLPGWPADLRRRRLDRRRAGLRTFADALARVYPVPGCWPGQVRDDTVVCRCEEVTAGAIREVAVRDGVADARSAKLLVRPGMGWCQGRICDYATECLVAGATGKRPDHRPVERPIAYPVPLGSVAGESTVATGPAAGETTVTTGPAGGERRRPTDNSTV